MKVFRIDETSYVAAEDEAQAREFYNLHAHDLSTEQAEVVEELSDVEMEHSVFTNEEGESFSFAAQLARLLAVPAAFPLMFAEEP